MYAKIFSSMWDGTLYGQWEAWSLLVFLLAKCDSEGFVDIHPTAISGMTGMPIEAVRKGIEILESPDAQSKSSELEGARIERIDEHRDWGWRIVNYLHYRRLVDPDVVKLQNRDRQKKRRHALSRSVTPGHAPSRQAEAEAEAEVKESNTHAHPAAAGPPSAAAECAGDAAQVHNPKKSPSPNGRAKLDPAWHAFFESDVWPLMPRKVGKQAAWKAWDRLKPSNELAAAILDGLRWYAEHEWANRPDDKIPHLVTWLNQERWRDLEQESA